MDGNKIYNDLPNQVNLQTTIKKFNFSGHLASNHHLVKSSSVDSDDVINIIGDLTLDQILDTPYWSDELKEAKFSTLANFEDSLMNWENVIQQFLVTFDYNTFGSYVEFYKLYKNAKQNLVDFVLSYQPSINRESMSCVALSLYLMKHLKQIDTKYGSMFSLVSCEEMIPIIDETETENIYQMESKNNVKEHVMICLKFSLNEDARNGYVLIDPGYHISRPIVVMNDSNYPHTGWFVASNNSRNVKEYCYQVVSDKFVMWKVKETKKGTSELYKEYVNIIYIQKEFIKYVNVTEKRALIFSMKTYVIRNRKGAVAGFYSWINQKDLTIFYEENGNRVMHKFAIDDIQKLEVKSALTKVASFMENNHFDLGQQVDKFLQILIDFKQTLYDEYFCTDLSKIDKWIDTN